MSVVDTLVATVTSGPFVLAAPIAAAAGLVSFLSPCVLPLVPGYLSYMTGLTAAELEDGSREEVAAGASRQSGGATTGGATAGGATTGLLDRPEVARGARPRVLAGSVLFVLGFSAVFVSTGAALGGVGSLLLAQQAWVNRVAGLLTIVLGLAFLGALPAMQREVRVHRLPQVGLAGAPLLGVTFGVGWTPCLGPTLAAIQTLAFTQAGAVRGALLTFVYSLGLGLPFLASALAFRRALRVFGRVRRHYRLVTRLGGGMLVGVGVALLTGAWAHLITLARTWISGFTTPL